jgi:hypothetical protein
MHPGNILTPAQDLHADERQEFEHKKDSYSGSNVDTRIAERLSDLGPNFPVDNDKITHQRVGLNSRPTISHIFGGSSGQTVCYIARKNQVKHGFEEPFLFPGYDFSPLLPAKIGECGVLFWLDEKLQKWVDHNGNKGPYHLFLHRGPGDYSYFGLYDCNWIEQMSQNEWLSQSQAVSRSSMYQAQ